MRWEVARHEGIADLPPQITPDNHATFWWGSIFSEAVFSVTCPPSSPQKICCSDVTTAFIAATKDRKIAEGALVTSQHLIGIQIYYLFVTHNDRFPNL
jgi:hypothetical protein